MSKRNKVYLLFAIFSTLFAVIATALITYFALTSPDSLTAFPDYSYQEYIDRSSDFEVDKDDGAQLYEAESFSLYGKASIKENLGASNQEEVSSLSKGASLSYSFSSPSSENYKLTLCMSYLSRNGKTANADSLFKVSVNDQEMSLSGISIQPTYNEYEFIENPLCIINVREGKNALEISSTSNLDFGFDYLVLTSNKDKNIDATKVIGETKMKNFQANDSKQKFEAEELDNTGSLIVLDEEASGLYASYFTEKEDAIKATINASAQTSTLLAISLKKSSSDNDAISLKITLNGKSIFSNQLTSLGVSYEEVVIGSITLQRDENIIEISDTSGVFYLDYLALDSNINYAASKVNQRYEAEEGYINIGQIVTETTAASNSSYVVLASNIGKEQFEFDSLVDDSSLVALRIGYSGKEKALSEIMDVSFNSSSLALSSIKVPEGTSLTNFVDIPLGKISLRRGINVLEISSFDISYSLDCITLYKNEITSSTNRYLAQGEELVSPTKLITTSNKNSSNNLSAYLTNKNEVSFYFSSDSRRSVNLDLYYSLITSSNSINDDLSLTLNNTEISLIVGSLPDITTQHLFTSLNLGSMTIDSGLNILTIKAKNSSFYLDYLLLSL
ncbi:MAG: hypothetical protein WCR56_02355 [Bacilli bacterium]|jgi:hypothetical protein